MHMAIMVMVVDTLWDEYDILKTMPSASTSVNLLQRTALLNNQMAEK